MLTFVQFLEEIERNHRTVFIEARELEHLVQRFGPAVRSMGFWNQGRDGSLEIPMSHIVEAVAALDDRTLAQALEQLKTPGGQAGILKGSAAAQQLIGELAQIHSREFQRKVERLQNTDSDAEAERLRAEISRELFGA